MTIKFESADSCGASYPLDEFIIGAADSVVKIVDVAEQEVRDLLATAIANKKLTMRDVDGREDASGNYQLVDEKKGSLGSLLFAAPSKFDWIEERFLPAVPVIQVIEYVIHYILWTAIWIHLD